MKALAWMILGLICSSQSFANPGCPDRPLKVGWEVYQPYQFEEKGVPKGIDIDILQLVMKSLGCDVIMVKMPWKRLLREVEKGSMDVTMGTSPSADRKKFGWMSSSYKEESVNLYVRTGDTAALNIASAEDLIRQGMRFGITSGAYHGPKFESLIQSGALTVGKNIFEVPTEKQLIEMLVERHIDGALLGGDEVNYHSDVKVHPHKLFVSDTVFMFSRKNVTPEFVEWFSVKLNALKASGEVKRIIDLYLKEKKDSLYR